VACDFEVLLGWVDSFLERNQETIIMGTDAHQVGKLCRDSNDSDSVSTHESMPELVPVVPQRYAPTSTQNGPHLVRCRKRAGAGERGPAAYQGRAHGLRRPGTWRNASIPGMPVVEPLPERSPDLASIGLAEPTPRMPEAALPDTGAFKINSGTSIAFGQKADVLAAMLDNVGTPSVSEELNTLKEDEANDDLDVIDISEVASIKADAIVDDFLEDAGALDGSDSEDEKVADLLALASSPSTGGEGRDVIHGQSHALTLRPRLESLPPGTPSAAPASSQVVAATRASNPVRGIDASSPKNSNSFGPRFRGLRGPALEKAKAKWTLHSLAEVSRSSAHENRQAAAMLIKELEERRQGAGSTAEPAPMASEAKPTFRRPAHPPEVSTKTPRSTAPVVVTPGAFVAEPCVAGMVRRRCEIPAVSTTGSETNSANDGGKAVIAALKRRRKISCLASEEEMAENC